MKKSLFVAALVITQIAFAQRAPREIKRMTVAEARSSVEKLNIFKEIEKVRAQGKDITKDANLRPIVKNVIESTLKKVTTNISTVEANNILILVNASPLEVMSEVARLSSIVQDKSSSANEVSIAKKNLDLIIKMSKTVESGSSEAHKAKVDNILKVSEKVSSLKGEKAEKFVSKFEKALAEGKSVTEAIKIASEGRFTLKELLDCV